MLNQEIEEIMNKYLQDIKQLNDKQRLLIKEFFRIADEEKIKKLKEDLEHNSHE